MIRELSLPFVLQHLAKQVFCMCRNAHWLVDMVRLLPIFYPCIFSFHCRRRHHVEHHGRQLNVSFHSLQYHDMLCKANYSDCIHNWLCSDFYLSMNICYLQGDLMQLDIWRRQRDIRMALFLSHSSSRNPVSGLVTYEDIQVFLCYS